LNPLLNAYSLFIGLRYTRAKRKTRFISFISLISVGGIALGITALIVVLSVMNGFQREIRGKILGVASHVQVMSNGEGIADWKAVEVESRKNPAVMAAAPFVNGQGMLVNGNNIRGVGIRGILPSEEATVSTLARDMLFNTKLDSLKAGEYGIVLGNELARALRVRAGEKIQLMAPQGSLTPAGLVPRLRSFTVIGLFSSGHYEYDLNLALIHLRDAQVLFRMEDNVSGLRLKLDQTDNAPLVAKALNSQFFDSKVTPNLYVTDWTQQNQTYFNAVQIEKRMMFIILLLIIAVAAFNLVATLVMAVTDKQSDIAILRTLGASPAGIMKIFMVQGALIGMIGTVLGVIAGVALAWNVGDIVAGIEKILGQTLLAKELYFVPRLPSDLHWGEVGLVASLALGMALIATIYPSLRAANVRPAEALRYE
jgi:lipoprotein-releasing system permease protein